MVAILPWVKNVNVTMSAQPAKPLFADQLPAGLQTISNIVAVSSCKVDLLEMLFLLIILVISSFYHNLGCFLVNIVFSTNLCFAPLNLKFLGIFLFCLNPPTPKGNSPW